MRLKTVFTCMQAATCMRACSNLLARSHAQASQLGLRCSGLDPIHLDRQSMIVLPPARPFSVCCLGFMHCTCELPDIATCLCVPKGMQGLVGPLYVNGDTSSIPAVHV